MEGRVRDLARRAAAALICGLLLSLGAGAQERLRVFHRTVVAADGTRLALYHYAPAAQSPLPPVLLIPDFGMNRNIFDAEGKGWAPFLAGHGRDAYVIEPRGHGASGSPRDWDLQDVVCVDVPAALDAIRALHPGRADLVVYGYSGTLVLAQTSDCLRDRVRRVVALATPVFPEVPSPDAERVLTQGASFGSFASSPGDFASLEFLFFHGGRQSRSARRNLASSSFDDLSELAGRQLFQWMKSGDFVFRNGQSTQALLRTFTLPTYVFVGLADNWAHPEYVTPLRELAAGAKVNVQLLSKISLLAEDYPHLSLVQSPTVAKDVFVPALQFLGAP